METFNKKMNDVEVKFEESLRIYNVILQKLGILLLFA